jgi:hypothetical protein
MSYLEGVRLDYDTADHITRLTLINSLDSINKDIAALQKKTDLKDHEKEDLEYDQKYRKSLLIVIRYYSTPSEMAELKASS